MSKNIYLLGHANAGKTSLFNSLTGSSNKVANYAGATTSLSRMPLRKDKSLILYDLPGTYALKSEAKDESLTIQTLKAAPAGSTLVFVLDGLQLKNQLLSVKNFIKHLDQQNYKIVIVVNMMDEVMANKVSIDFRALEALTKAKIFPISVKKNEGVKSLESFLKSESGNESSIAILEKIEPELIDSLITGQTNLALKKMYSIDRFLVSPFFGTIFFLFIMSVLFQAVFSWSAPFMDLVEGVLVAASTFSSQLFNNEYIISFVTDALFGGLGAFLVFTPQIFFLSLIIKALEESGYLTRASIISHKFLSYFGLSGESFIPLLTSHACAIPGAYAARHIKSKKVRLLTLLTLPLTLCSARLPVYALLITLTVSDHTYLGGLIGSRGLALFGLYIFGLFMTLIVSITLDKLKLKKEGKTFLALELPRYQMPDFRGTFKHAFSTTVDFVKDAGPVIFFTNSFVWALASFPNGPGNIKTSYLAELGQVLMPISSPIGLNWPETIAVLTSFLARETFVSTLATIYGAASDEASALSELISNNAELYTTASALSLMVFFAIALQCVSTLAVLRKELPQAKMVYTLFFGYLALAYIASFITYRLSLLLF